MESLKTVFFALFCLSVSCVGAREDRSKSISVAVVPGAATHEDVAEMFQEGGGLRESEFMFTTGGGVKFAVFLRCGGDHQEVDLDCQARQEGELIHISPRIYTRDPNDMCSSDLVVFCDSIALSDGVYNFVHAEKSISLAIPSNAAWESLLLK